jgi:hypothetical protein
MVTQKISSYSEGVPGLFYPEIRRPMAAGILTGFEAPKLLADLLTPLIGIRQKIDIGVFML